MFIRIEILFVSTNKIQLKLGILKLNMKDVLASGSGTSVERHSHGERRLLPQSSTKKNYFPDSSSYGHHEQCTVTFSLAQKVGKPKCED